MNEKSLYQSVLENNPERGTNTNNRDNTRFISIKTETHSAKGKETHHIYDGQRINVKDLEKYKICSARTGLPPAKIANFIEKCGPDELRRILAK